MKTRDFDFELPAASIAQAPPLRRGHSRLLVLDRSTGTIGHTKFSTLPDYLAAGDLLVVNRSRVLPARLLGQMRGGGQAELLYLFAEAGEPEEFRAMVRPARRLRIGSVVTLSESERCRVTALHPDGTRTLRFEGHAPVLDLLQRFGRLPLPPYIDRAAGPLDEERYQTVYAREPGSIAAPTAGLHFTDTLLKEITGRGIVVCEILLHVGPGTFARVDAEDIADHTVSPERFLIPPETATAYEIARSRGRQVIAVGTTTVRAMETIGTETRLTPGPGETGLVIRPGHKFRTVDGLLTNFHLPKSSLLFLVSAFAGREKVLMAYRKAIEANYRFYSYGDAMFIKPSRPTGHGG